MVSASLQRVGLAGQAFADISIVFTSGNSNLGEPVPGTSRLTTVAPKTHGAGGTGAACIGIFGREDKPGPGGNAEAIVEGLEREFFNQRKYSWHCHKNYLSGAKSPINSAVTA